MAPKPIKSHSLMASAMLGAIWFLTGACASSDSECPVDVDNMVSGEFSDDCLVSMIPWQFEYPDEVLGYTASETAVITPAFPTNLWVTYRSPDSQPSEITLDIPRPGTLCPRLVPMLEFETTTISGRDVTAYDHGDEIGFCWETEENTYELRAPDDTRLDLAVVSEFVNALP